jgi:L-lactate dehydrogenase
MPNGVSAPPKIAIAGTGHVGVTLAYACLIPGTGKTVALWGRNADKVRAEVLDLQHGLQFVPMATVVGPDDVEVCRDANVVVMTIGGNPQLGQTRLDLAAESVAVCRTVLPRLLDVAPDAVVVIVTNPVDVITYAALKILGLPRSRVLGPRTRRPSAVHRRRPAVALRRRGLLTGRIGPDSSRPRPEKTDVGRTDEFTLAGAS